MLTTLWSVLWYGAWTIAGLYFAMTLAIWGATLRTFGPSCLRHCPRMLRLSLRAGPIRELSIAVLLPLLGIGLIEFYRPLGAYLAHFPISALALIGVLCLTLFPVPPIAVVFSSSTDKQLRWALSLKRFTAGRRVISLLDTGYLAVKPRLSDAWLITIIRSGSLTDVLRTSNPNRWQSVVRELIEISPIIIVDTRVCTPALLFEASSVLTSEYAYKAIFIRADDGTSPVLERLLSEGRVAADFRVRIVKESELGELLRQLVPSRDTLPKQGSSTAETITKSISRDVRHLSPSYEVKSVPPFSSPAPVPTGSTRLSSGLTPFWRVSVRTALIQLPLATMGLVWMTLSLPQSHPYSRYVVPLWWLLLFNSVSCVWSFFITRSLKTVDLKGNSLLVSDKSGECEIPISLISEVSGPDRMQRITIHLHETSRFGKQIVFAGRFFGGGKVVRNLRQLLYTSEARKSETWLS
jgi:hypothetical protein